MTSLIFQELPPGPVPLFVCEPREGVLETGTLLLDHVGRTVRFVQSDPFAPFEVPQHSIHRYSWWDVDAMMPRWQLGELYGEARPLLERIQMGTTMSRADTHWLRAQTPEAEATNALLDELTERRPAAPVDWVPAPRTVRPETALVQAIRDYSLHHAMHTVGHAIERRTPVVSIATGAGKTQGSFVLATKALKKIRSGSETDLEISTLKGDSRVQLQMKGHPGVSLFTSTVEAQLRLLREQERMVAGRAQWSRLFEQTDTRRMAG